MTQENFKNIEQALKRAKTMRLSAFDKGEIRKALLNQMPAPARIVRKTYSWHFLYMRVPVAAAFILILTVGTSAAASGAVPGDTLYGVKVGVNEKIETLLTFSEKGMAEVTAKHALTRLAEAETLAWEGKLDAETKSQVEEQFYESVADLRSNLKKLEGKGNFSAAANVSGSFEEGLGEHLGTFVNLSGIASATPEIVSMADSVGLELQSTQNERIALRDRQVSTAATTTVPAAKNSLDEATKKVAEVESFITTQTGSTSSSVNEGISVKIGAAKSALADASASFSSGDYAQTFILSKKAQTLAQDAKLIAILGTKVKKGLSVRTGGGSATAKAMSLKEKGEDDTKSFAPATFSATLKMEVKGDDENKTQINEDDRGINIEINHEDREGARGAIRLNIDL